MEAEAEYLDHGEGVEEVIEGAIPSIEQPDVFGQLQQLGQRAVSLVQGLTCIVGTKVSFMGARGGRGGGGGLHLDSTFLTFCAGVGFKAWI